MQTATKALSVFLFSSTLGLALLGCQPNNAHSDSDHSADAMHDEHHDDDHAHGEDAHSEHNQEHMQDGHMNDAHDDDEHAHAEHNHAENDHLDHAAHSGHNHDSHRIIFDCKPTAQIGVSYHDDDKAPTAHLLINGIEYELNASNQGNADTVTTYVSDFGLDDSHGLVWQTSSKNGSETATLSASSNPADANSTLETLYQCQKAS